MSAACEVIEEVAVTARAAREELARLLECDDATAEELYAAADGVRARAVGDEVHLRALVEFSNTCRRDCLYCGLRRSNKALSRYRMAPEKIVAVGREAARLGFGTVVLQSGEDPWYSADALAEVVRGIRRGAETAVTLSIGERRPEEYLTLRRAGADRFLLRIETSSPTLFGQLHPDSDWQARRECLAVLREQGYQVGSGVMIGLPDQTTEMLADDLLFLQSLDLDMIGVGPFIPHPATPLASATGGTLGLALRFVACMRLLCPQALIPATTALGALHPEGRQQALRAGANVLMPNCTPVAYRERYQLYPGRLRATDSAAEGRRRAEEMVAGLGRRVAEGRGDSRRRDPRVETRGSKAAAAQAG
ncbi:MAG: [FeFe] hydrogenase H-cluster radical SAM maturase HydE [Armatimonadota bacterium]